MGFAVKRSGAKLFKKKGAVLRRGGRRKSADSLVLRLGGTKPVLHLSVSVSHLSAAVSNVWIQAPSPRSFLTRFCSNVPLPAWRACLVFKAPLQPSLL